MLFTFVTKFNDYDHHLNYHRVDNVVTTPNFLILVPSIVALTIALLAPYIQEWWRKRFEKSHLTIVGDHGIITDQENFGVPPQKNQILKVARLAIENNGNFKAKSVEAYIEEIEWDGEKRENFIPMPLAWTHRQSVRDIYAHQTVYLDLLYVRHAPHMAGDKEILLAVATGQGVDTLSKLNPFGKSKILIKLYEESGQVTPVTVSVSCKDITVTRVDVDHTSI